MFSCFFSYFLKVILEAVCWVKILIFLDYCYGFNFQEFMLRIYILKWDWFWLWCIPPILSNSFRLFSIWLIVFVSLTVAAAFQASYLLFLTSNFLWIFIAFFFARHLSWAHSPLDPVLVPLLDTLYFCTMNPTWK